MLLTFTDEDGTATVEKWWVFTPAFVCLLSHTEHKPFEDVLFPTVAFQWYLNNSVLHYCLSAVLAAWMGHVWKVLSVLHLVSWSREDEPLLKCARQIEAPTGNLGMRWVKKPPKARITCRCLEASIEDFLCCLSLVQLEESAVPVLRDKASYTARISCGELTRREEVGANLLCFRVPHWDFHRERRLGGLHLWLGEITQIKRKCYSHYPLFFLISSLAYFYYGPLLMSCVYAQFFPVVHVSSTCS